ncbi:Uncharacterised protein [Mycobacteroides abscessus subsp. abscessus]|nr:Uncharacterised protein [Mycobacteroides abscessus subsp. abscessus]
MTSPPSAPRGACALTPIEPIDIPGISPIECPIPGMPLSRSPANTLSGSVPVPSIQSSSATTSSVS